MLTDGEVDGRWSTNTSHSRSSVNTVQLMLGYRKELPRPRQTQLAALADWDVRIFSSHICMRMRLRARVSSAAGLQVPKFVRDAVLNLGNVTLSVQDTGLCTHQQLFLMFMLSALDALFMRGMHQGHIARCEVPCLYATTTKYLALHSACKLRETKFTAVHCCLCRTWHGVVASFTVHG